MTIAVHISISDTKNDPSKNFNYRCCSILAEKYPSHHFIFIFDKTFNPLLITQKNITPVLLSPQIRNRLLAHFWYNFKLPSLLNKYHADIFISDGLNCSIRAAVKQCMIIQDMSFLQKENQFTRGEIRYIKKFFKRFVTKTSCLAVSNQHTNIEFKKTFPESAGKLHVIGCGLNETGIIPDHQEQQIIKNKFTGGKEYFICYITDISAPNTTVLLKAFSTFKKRQLSNMQLLLVLNSTQKENPVKDFATYKYRDDVKLITVENDQFLSEITAAAYAAIYLPARDILETNGLLAIKNNCPLITISNEFCKSLYNDAALYAKTEEKNIAEKMMLIYKNENLKNELVHIGKFVGSIYSWNNTATNLWQALVHTAEQ